jgi:translocator protein
MSNSVATAPDGAFKRAMLAVVPVVAVSILGRLATASNLPWFETLIKPAFNPPNWVFAPVWTILYAAMALVAWRLLGKPATSQRRTALVLYFGQLALNAAWPWTFFWLHSPLAGLLSIVPQALAVAATILVVRRVDPMSAWLLIPLAAWVGFATVLNLEVWRLNG